MTLKLFRALLSARVSVARAAASTYLVLAQIDKQATYSIHRSHIVYEQVFFKCPHFCGSLNA